jgi:hypothetical protein
MTEFPWNFVVFAALAFAIYPPHSGPKSRKRGQNLKVFLDLDDSRYIYVFRIVDYEFVIIKKKNDGFKMKDILKCFFQNM